MWAGSSDLCSAVDPSIWMIALSGSDPSFSAKLEWSRDSFVACVRGRWQHWGRASGLLAAGILAMHGLGREMKRYEPASSRLSSLTLQAPDTLLPPFGSHLGRWLTVKKSANSYSWSKLVLSSRHGIFYLFCLDEVTQWMKNGLGARIQRCAERACAKLLSKK